MLIDIGTRLSAKDLQLIWAKLQDATLRMVTTESRNLPYRGPALEHMPWHSLLPLVVGLLSAAAAIEDFSKADHSNLPKTLARLIVFYCTTEKQNLLRPDGICTCETTMLSFHACHPLDATITTQPYLAFSFSI